MELFRFEDTRVSPAPHTLLIETFKRVWDRDKSKDKKLALRELAFVFYLMDYKSVYLSSIPEEREQVIIDDLFPDNPKWVPDPLVREACAKYDELQITPAMRFLKSQLNALEKSIVYFNGIDYKEKDSKGKAVYSISEVTTSMSKAAGVLESLEKIAERVKKELSVQGRIRGGGESGLYED